MIATSTSAPAPLPPVGSCYLPLLLPRDLDFGSGTVDSCGLLSIVPLDLHSAPALLLPLIAFCCLPSLEPLELDFGSGTIASRCLPLLVPLICSVLHVLPFL